MGRTRILSDAGRNWINPIGDKENMTAHVLSKAVHQLVGGQTAYTALTTPDRTTPQLHQSIGSLQPVDVFTEPLVDTEEGKAALSGIWLWHDALEPSHSICQSIETPTGSFWHAILHRREGDFSNAKYWYARARKHPALQTIASHVEHLLERTSPDAKIDRLIVHGEWNGSAFVDAVERWHGSPNDPRHHTLVALQRVEWEGLFDSCVRAAVGK